MFQKRLDLSRNKTNLFSTWVYESDEATRGRDSRLARRRLERPCGVLRSGRFCSLVSLGDTSPVRQGTGSFMTSGSRIDAIHNICRQILYNNHNCMI